MYAAADTEAFAFIVVLCFVDDDFISHEFVEALCIDFSGDRRDEFLSEAQDVRLPIVLDLLVEVVPLEVIDNGHMIVVLLIV